MPSMKNELHQTMKHTVTPRQRQALAVLAMNCVELETFVENEQLENPLLEIDSSFQQLPAESVVDIARWLDRAPPPVENGVYSDEGFRENEALFTSHATLRDDWKEQLYSKRLPAPIRDLAERMTELIDDRGLLPYREEELVALLAASPENIRAAKSAVRELEPFGTGCRSIGEFLLLQLEQDGKADDFLRRICMDWFDRLAEGGYREIAEALGLKPADVRRYAKLIGTLRPYPVLDAGEDSPVEYIVPDIFVAEKDGELGVYIDDGRARGLSISGYYRDYLAQADETAREYLRQKIQRARFLIEAVEQRRRTLARIAEQLIVIQRNFFLGGELVPATYREIAERTGLHETTVGRALRGKYLQCRRGTYPAKYFFAAGVPDGGEGVSRERVKELLCGLVAAEDPHRPLSDAKLCAALAAQGIEVSRRTVAKYRAECGIKGTADRKKEE